MSEAVVHEVLNLLRGVWKGVEKEWQTQARKLDLTPSQQHILWILFFEEGITISNLSERALMHITTTTDVVKRMEKHGLLRVENCPHDGRAYLFYLTDLGKRKWKDSLQQGDKWPLLSRVASLPPDERQVLLKILRQWASHFQDDEYLQWVATTREKMTSVE